MTAQTPHQSARDADGAFLSPLRHRDFRLFWTGLVLSGVGSQFTTVAMAWQIYELTDSPFQIGLLGLARGVPQIGLLLVGGLLADAINRRKLMMCTQIILSAISATLALLTLAGQATPLALYAATILLALFSSLDSPARHSIVPNLVPPEDLAKAVALNSSQRHVSVIVGPSLAGLVLAFSGPATCYGVDAVSWLVMLAALVGMRTKLQEGKGWSSVSLHSLREGFKFVWGHAVIFPLMVLDFGANFFGSSKALFPVYARDILAVGPEGLGLLYAATAVGSLGAAAGVSMFGRVRRSGLWIIGGIAIYGGCTVLFAGSHHLLLSILLLGLAGAGDTISTIHRGTINQLSTPDELRGRMVSINSIFTGSGPTLGQFESGLVAAWLGAELSALTGGLATLVVLAIVAASFPNIRRYQIGQVLQRGRQESPF